MKKVIWLISSIIITISFLTILLITLLLPMGTYKSQNGTWDRIEIESDIIAAYKLAFIRDKETNELKPIESGFKNCPYKRNGNEFIVEDLDYIIYRVSPFSLKFSDQDFFCLSKMVMFTISVIFVTLGSGGIIISSIFLKKAQAKVEQLQEEIQKDDE